MKEVYERNTEIVNTILSYVENVNTKKEAEFLLNVSSQLMQSNELLLEYLGRNVND